MLEKKDGVLVRRTEAEDVIAVDEQPECIRCLKADCTDLGWCFSWR
jgi:hypothetical protein